MLSMTGYGKSEYKENGLELTCELKSVNNRYLDVLVKSPRIFSGLEEEIRSCVRASLTRGHIEVYVSYRDKRDTATTLEVDEVLADGYVKSAKKLKELFPELKDDFSLTSLMRMPDVMVHQEESVDENLKSGLFKALTNALENHRAMRQKEGEKLKADLLGRMDEIERLVGKIVERAPLIAQEYREKLSAKIKEYLGGVDYDETRLLTEVAVFTDKSNIDEELTRLKSHIFQFRQICQDEIVGRKLDFLVQEFNREANTTCSKSNDLEITHLGLLLKNEIEKVREQVQNLE